MELIIIMQQLLLMIMEITSDFEVAPVRLQGSTKWALSLPVPNIVRKL
jgi:hypothetical protein